MSRSKQKGTSAETAVVSYLRGHGFPNAERRALHGGADQGDITGVPGVVFEVKALIDGKPRISQWMRETENERRNATADLGLLVIKPAGLGDVNIARWHAFFPLPVFQATATTSNANTMPPAIITSHGANYRMYLRSIEPLPGSPNAERIPYLQVHPRGKPEPGDWWALCTLANATKLLRIAGYGDLLKVEEQ